MVEGTKHLDAPFSAGGYTEPMERAVRSRRSIWRSYGVFYSQFRQNFLLTGAIAPSGRQLARAVTQNIARTAGRPVRVLEVGAGTGVLTTAILARLHTGDRFDIYEINPVFRSFIATRIEESQAAARGIDCRLHIAGVEALPPDASYEFIVSALPLNNFPARQVEQILQLLMAHLEPAGVLSYFEYPYLRGLKQAFTADRAERARLRAVGRVVSEFLCRHRWSEILIAFNLPPAVVRHIERVLPYRAPAGPAA